VVESACGVVNATLPGPLYFSHVVVRGAIITALLVADPDNDMVSDEETD
jgi:hypothetical protein